MCQAGGRIPEDGMPLPPMLGAVDPRIIPSVSLVVRLGLQLYKTHPQAAAVCSDSLGRHKWVANHQWAHARRSQTQRVNGDAQSCI